MNETDSSIPFDSSDQDNMHDSAHEDKWALALVPPPATRDILFGGTNLISHESVYIIWKIRTRVSLVIDVHFERALLSKALHGHICIRAYVYTYARTYAAASRRCVCLVYLFYFILVYLGKAMSRGYIVVRKYQGVQHLQFSIRRRRTHLHNFSPRQCCVCAHPRELYRVYTRLRLFSISDVYVTAGRIKRSPFAAAHSREVFIPLSISNTGRIW